MAFVRAALAITLLAVVAACSADGGEQQGSAGASASSDSTAPANINLRLGRDVWNSFQLYLTSIDKTKHGAFAIAKDGTSASSAATCDAANCTDTTQVQAEALSACETKGGPCMVFALDRVTQTPYRMPE